MGYRDQYYNITVSSDEKDSTGKKTGKIAKQDLTEDVIDDVIYSDEDEKIRLLSFNLRNGYLWMDVLTLGMRVDLIGGTLDRNELVFAGFIKQIKPLFRPNGDITLSIECYGHEWVMSALLVSDRFFPSSNCPFDWGKVNKITATEIITNLAKDCGFLIGRISPKKDITYTSTSPKRQHKITDYRFMLNLCKETSSIMWFTFKDGKVYIYVDDEARCVNRVADHTFFFPARVGNEFKVVQSSDKQIQMLEVDLELDPLKGGAKTDLTVSQDKEGNDVLTKQEQDANGDWNTYILDKEKLERLSYEEQNELLLLTSSGNATWEDVSGYFKKISITELSARDPTPAKIEIVKLSGDPKKDGVTTGNTSPTTGNASATANVDPEDDQSAWEVNPTKVSKMPREKMNEFFGKFYRGEADWDDVKMYCDRKTPDDNKVENRSSEKESASADDGKKKKKRDAGFHITVTAYGNLDIQTRVSYFLEGLGKYAAKYYLFRKVYTWGREGFMMKLTFTK